MFLGGCNLDTFINALDNLTDPTHITGDQGQGEGNGQGQNGEGEGEGEGNGQGQTQDDSIANIAVNMQSMSLKVGGTKEFDYSVTPSSQKANVEVRSTDENVATVANKRVTAVGAGECDIIIHSLNSDVAALIHVTVTSNGSQGGGEEVPVDSIYLSTSSLSLEVNQTKEVTIYATPSNATDKRLSFNFDNTYLTVSQKSGSDTVYEVTAKKTGLTSIEVVSQSNSSITRTISVTISDPQAQNVPVTSISISPSSLTLDVNETKQVSFTVLPSNATNPALSLLSGFDNTVVKYTTGGYVQGLKAGSTTLTFRAKDGSGVTATLNVTVKAPASADYSATVLVYMCGANLESDYANKTSYQGYTIDGIGLATADIKEMLSVPNKPNDVNIVIETGGANTWTNKSYGQYGTESISSSYLQRWHVANQKLVKDENVITNPNAGTESAKYAYASMGLSTTLQSFIEYGLNNYPADKTYLILWNHGGAMQGVCFDEKKNDDGLEGPEVVTAVKNALKNTGHEGEKLEMIGYDACLMQFQDNALLNAPYFNYMVGSQELEAGEGWAYSTWLDDLYAKKSTPEVLTELVDGFIESTEMSEEEYQYWLNQGYTASELEEYRYSDQTLSYLDLSYADEYKTAWENLASAINTVNPSKSYFVAQAKRAKYYANDGEGTEQYYAMFDVKDYVNKLTASNSYIKVDSSYTNAVLEAFSHFVPHSAKGHVAGNAYGLSAFIPVWSYAGRTTYYASGSQYTTLSNWRSLCYSKCT